MRMDTRGKVEGWKGWEGRLEEGDGKRGKEGWHTAWDRRTGGSRWECGEEMKQREFLNGHSLQSDYSHMISDKGRKL